MIKGFRNLLQTTASNLPWFAVGGIVSASLGLFGCLGNPRWHSIEEGTYELIPVLETQTVPAAIAPLEDRLTALLSPFATVRESAQVLTFDETNLLPTLHLFHPDAFLAQQTPSAARAVSLPLEPPVSAFIHESGFPMQVAEFGSNEIPRHIRAFLPQSVEVVHFPESSQTNASPAGNLSPEQGVPNLMIRVQAGLSPEAQIAQCRQYLTPDAPTFTGCSRSYPFNDVRIYGSDTPASLTLASSAADYPKILASHIFNSINPLEGEIPGSSVEHFPVDNIFVPECVYRTYARAEWIALSPDVLEFRITVNSVARSQSAQYPFVHPRHNCDELAQIASQASPNRFLKFETVRMRFKLAGTQVSLPEGERRVPQSAGAASYGIIERNRDSLNMLTKVRGFR